MAAACATRIAAPHQCGANSGVILAQAAIRDAFKEIMGRNWGGMWLNAAQMAV